MSTVEETPAEEAVSYPLPVGIYPMSCRCGKALLWRDMCRLIPQRKTALRSLTIARIVCITCALKARA